MKRSTRDPNSRLFHLPRDKVLGNSRMLIQRFGPVHDLWWRSRALLILFQTTCSIWHCPSANNAVCIAIPPVIDCDYAKPLNRNTSGIELSRCGLHTVTRICCSWSTPIDISFKPHTIVLCSRTGVKSTWQSSDCFVGY